MSNTELGIVPRTVSEIPSLPYRFLEWFVFTFLIMLSIPAIAASLFYPSGGVQLVLFSALPAVLFALLTCVVVPILVYGDATLVRSLDFEWKPNAVRFAFIAFLLSPVMALFSPIAAGIDAVIQHAFNSYRDLFTVGVRSTLQIGPPVGALYYLHRRHKHIPVSGTSQFWWVLLPLISLSGLTFLVTAAILPTNALFISPIIELFRVSLPIAAYMDALFLRNNQYSWNPNPAVQYLLAYISILVFPESLLYVIYTGYHIGRRWRARPS